MNKTKSITLLIVIIIFAFLFGSASGIFYQKQKDAPQIKEKTEVIQKLSSKIVSAIIVFGNVYSINSDRSITLSYQGDKITILTLQNAKIYKYNNSTKKEAQFQDIKVGDSINVTAEINSDGQLQGNTIIIFNNIGN